MKAKTGKVIAAAQAGKSAKAGKVNIAATAGKAAKVVAKAKPAVKVNVKSKVKPTEKARTAVKPVGKPVVKSTGKVTAKKAAAVKVPVKMTVHVKGSERSAKAKPDLAVKAVKAAPKGKVKDSAKATISKAVKPPTRAQKVKVAPVPTLVKPVPSAPAPTVHASVPVRAGRPSSRLAQLTVPSMAQSVASTAAKASFTQTMVSPLIVPPLASAIRKDPKLANNWKSKSVEQLTDAELIAMPDSEYMSEFQMAFFRRRLIQLKKDILSNAGETTEHLREDTVVVPDPADRATIEEEHALELRTRDRERKLLKKIEQSIARIDAGDYGYCDETGEPIGVGRLLARPTANLSLEAQQRRELKQKMFGD